MIGFVLGGGGNRGALQAGALQALLGAGIRPDILVGSSAGALNAVGIALDPSPRGADRVVRFWTGSTREEVFPGRLPSLVNRLVRGRSLYPSDGLRRKVVSALPAADARFGDLSATRLYLTAANLNTGALYLWGDDLRALLIDAVMASAAHPLLFPPVEVGEVQLVDGGVAANVPVGIAVDRGATEVYVLDLGSGVDPNPAHSMIGRVMRSFAFMMRQNFLIDLQHVLETTGTVVHHIPMSGFADAPVWDPSVEAQMVVAGREITARYLADPQPLTEVPWPGASPQRAPVGASEYRPRYMLPSEVLDLPDLPRLVVRHLSRRGPLSPAELSAAMGMDQSGLAPTIASMLAAGQLRAGSNGRLEAPLGVRRGRDLPGMLFADP